MLENLIDPAEVKRWLSHSGLRILAVIIGTYIIARVINFFSARAMKALATRVDSPEAWKRAETLGAVLRYVINITLLAVALMICLKEAGIDIGPVLAAAGVAGLAVGFGAQSLVQDVISGFFILLEDQIRVGDVVDLGGKSGLVEKVSLRTVVLRDLAGNVHFVRNGQIGTVTNMTKEFSCYVFDIGVAYREDVDEVVEVIKQVDTELRADPAFIERILEPIEIMGLDKFADSAVVIRARTKTKPIEQWNVGREFNRRLKKRFDELGIEIPFPHLTLYMGADKKGNSPAANIVIKKEQ